MKLKELILRDDKFNQRISFYENSCDITKTIANYLNSSDIKYAMEEMGPYAFKDLNAQDQLVLIRLQYEGKIKELEQIVDSQKQELSKLKSSKQLDVTGKV